MQSTAHEVSCIFELGIASLLIDVHSLHLHICKDIALHSTNGCRPSQCNACTNSVEALTHDMMLVFECVAYMRARLDTTPIRT